MLSTLEILPDEILIMIFTYSGDVITILRAFLGLNRRFNRILLDKRLHLLSDFVQINIRDDYYKFDVIQQVSQRLLIINGPMDKKHLCQLLQPLLSLYTQHKYLQSQLEFEYEYHKFLSVRQQLSDDQRTAIDLELETEFNELRNGVNIVTETYVERIRSLVLNEGAKLVCENNELTQFNLCQAINNLLLQFIYEKSKQQSALAKLCLKLFKILLISNPSNMKNRDYVGNGGCDVSYFFICVIFHLQHFYHSRVSTPLVNMDIYRAIVDLFLFAMQCQKQTFQDANHIKRIMFNMLNMVEQTHKNMFIQATQWGIVQIIADEYSLFEHETSDDYYCSYAIRGVLKNLMKNSRIDILRYICRHSTFQDDISSPGNIRETVNILTSGRSHRRLFCEILNDESFDFLRSNKTLIFILLDKKERQIVENLVNRSRDVLNQLDADGNDPLLHVCLKVAGCRHRIIEYLLKMGSNTERRNFEGRNFTDALQLPRNEKLLKHLREHEIIAPRAMQVG
ncbi:unnamed protein product [Adineta ricciae]|uniref:Uncharacterized protein n=1 Tax=Adineta ricciae TaxID=249248 RepID=A0A815TNG7_ADIRI|nr:unnamed protein product [Adineta ricciae]